MSLSPLNYLTKATRENPEKICLKIYGKELSFLEFADSLRPIKAFFASNGIIPGRKVAINTDDDLLMLQSIFSLWEIGATAIPMNIRYTPDKLREIEKNI